VWACPCPCNEQCATALNCPRPQRSPRCAPQSARRRHCRFAEEVWCPVAPFRCGRHAEVRISSHAESTIRCGSFQRRQHMMAARVRAYPLSPRDLALREHQRSCQSIVLAAGRLRIEVVDVGVAGDARLPRGVRNERVTGHQGPLLRAAMTDDEADCALSGGERCAREAVQRGANCYCR